jgi:dienelactone hydrolase
MGAEAPAGSSASATTPATAPSAAPVTGAATAGQRGDGISTHRGDTEIVTFPSGTQTLHGFLHVPAGAGPFPVIVYNHGSERLPGAKDGQAEFFVPRGFAVFVPHRRGHGRSRDVGSYIGDMSEDPDAFVAELVAQSDDVMAAVAWVRAQPFADPGKIAAIGCSLGGIESLLAAERGTGLAAAVDFAGAAMMWARMPPLQARMKGAARGAKVPVFFVQAENDYDTSPSKVLSEEMRAAGKPMRYHVYPPNGSGPEDGHSFCMGGRTTPWGDEVLAFLASAGVTPAGATRGP